ncbi:four-carbon acid sugar kinase family protein [Umezakia ovalisporum]|uniref:Four-carbon acid sugar kinase family protein n=2 Tax=Umezakia ovalisporum TaxID=75695 RepID=A0AA43GYX5_9CYAN|nr:four-carbon acid sugar kinase family protein [Umezakia ovalisporum]MDH6056533.1 four-carbon acid sugar kinase family protein [Umezakia ovalisporum FSS-43]MDH6064051.1 four-carbon acid sugar kinase family protein [Umezakia ovalisporum FSS-62]MDH6065773.1 four-carbon acid sugar kinase family protein [Umezakia ovalisporum APH033B]MDH6069283.1 four-carbon acid sugar kinase family protein [Umezakia ovalisporum CobakiLakeA]MDH6076165.1 four-carbon acid sugar kinase family protein [Umezakia ovalis
MSNKPKIIVLDDDPTGSQTVHSCLLLMQWDVDTLRLALKDDSPIFFILTNTRALPPESAASVTTEVCQNLKRALAAENLSDFLIVSRSDSTLRGHYPIETDAIAEELGPFDAHFLVPAFFEGGRITRDSVHYLSIDGTPTPVHETEFARDSVFGYHHSYLPKYVDEKTQGRISAESVTRFLLDDIRAGSLERLLQLSNNQCAVVDGETQADLNCFAVDVLEASSQGKRFLFRSAASILTALAALPPQPIAAENMAEYVRKGKPGAVIVGSHVKKTTQQLQALLQVEGTVGIEVDVARLLDDQENEFAQLLTQVLESTKAVHNAGKTPVVYTSRQELTFNDVRNRLQFGVKVSGLLMDIVRGLPSDIGFLISKGGITSNDVLSNGLCLNSARLLGQILAGCSMVITTSEHPQFPNLPVVLFPGNVGDADALGTIYKRLTRNRYSSP